MDDLDSAIYYSAWNACIAETIKRFPVDLYHINGMCSRFLFFLFRILLVVAGDRFPSSLPVTKSLILKPFYKPC
jgi:hypothetical protein